MCISLLKGNRKYMAILHKLKKISIITKRYYYPFASRISDGSYHYIKSNCLPIDKWEDERPQLKEYISTIFDGSSVAIFAAARMGFYAILKSLNLPSQSEVILTGFTCSVMVNAVIRAGYRPVYADVDANTMGSSPKEIEKKITALTKVVVAQHSFGIPCKIDEIKQLCTDRGLFLIEDCAIAFLSTYKGVKLGLWGDAAIFSLDRTKPVNTFIGGYVITKQESLYKKLVEIEEDAKELPIELQKKILKRLCVEYAYFSPSKYPVYRVLKSCKNIIYKILGMKVEYVSLNKDSSSIPSLDNVVYPYPAKYPKALSHICMLEIQSYIQNIDNVKRRTGKILHALANMGISLPLAYLDSANDILPLRIVFVLENNRKRAFFSQFYEEDSYWYKHPIVNTKEKLENFGYQMGECPKAEQIGTNIVNVSILNLSDADVERMFGKYLNLI